MKQFKDIREANNKMAFLKRVKERFPKIAKNRPTMDRIVQIVKPKNQINSKRYVELGKLYDSGNMKKLNDLITKFEKEDGIRETFTEFRMPPITMGRDNTIVGVRDHDILAREGTTSSGIFDDDKNKAKNATRKLVQFLRANKNVRVFFDPDNPKKDHKDLAAYTKELTKYVFDDQMLDDLIPDPKRNKKNYGKKANEIVIKRLNQLGKNIF